MKKLSFAAVIALASLASLSSASFDLMLVRESAKVHRIDPVSGAYLGSFNVGSFLSSTAMTASFVQKRAYFANGNAIQSYNYSTGDDTGYSPDLATGGIRCLGMSPTQSIIYAGTIGGYICRFDAATMTRQADFAVLGAGNDVQEMLALGDGHLLTIEGTSTGHFFRNYSSAGTLVSSVKFDSGTTVYRGGLALFGNSVYWSTAGLNTFDYGSYFGTSNAYSGVIADPNFTGLNGMTNGHTGAYISGIASPSANGYTIERLDGYANTSYTYSFSNITNALGSTIVLAPEPGSCIALGLGAVALLRRRSRAAS